MAAPAETPVPTGPPDAAADELQRLAALAMAQFSDGEEAGTSESVSEQTQPEPIPEAPKVEAPPPQEYAPVPVPEAQIEPEPTPVAIEEPKLEPEPVPEPPTPVQTPSRRSVTEPLPPLSSLEFSKPKAEPVPVAAPSPTPDATPAPETSPASVAINLNSCRAEDLLQIPGCTTVLAESIVQYRTKIGSFKKLEDLYDVPGMTQSIYTSLTGEAPPADSKALPLNELLGFPPEQKVSLKDVTDRIACWPDVTGCVLSQSSGLSLVGTVPSGLDKAAIVAFAPRMFEALNKSFHEITGKETDELIIPTAGASFHILRNKDLYLIILSRLPQMPDRHMKVARFVLAALSIRQN